jgi:hypothetical protein
VWFGVRKRLGVDGAVVIAPSARARACVRTSHMLVPALFACAGVARLAAVPYVSFPPTPLAFPPPDERAGARAPQRDTALRALSAYCACGLPDDAAGGTLCDDDVRANISSPKPANTSTTPSH